MRMSTSLPSYLTNLETNYHCIKVLFDEMPFHLYMFGLVMLNKIMRNINNSLVVSKKIHLIVWSKSNFCKQSSKLKEFPHTFSYSTKFSLNTWQSYHFLFLASPSNKVFYQGSWSALRLTSYLKCFMPSLYLYNIPSLGDLFIYLFCEYKSFSKRKLQVSENSS